MLLRSGETAACKSALSSTSSAPVIYPKKNVRTGRVLYLVYAEKGAQKRICLMNLFCQCYLTSYQYIYI